MPAQNVLELVAVSKTRQLNWTSSGLGGMGHLSGELLKRMTGIEMLYVNYKGTGPALIDTLAGQVHVMFVNPLPAVPHIRAGRLRLLASTDAKRIGTMPEVPTIAESGVPGFSTNGWNGMLVPAGTPRSIIRIVNEAVAAIIKSPSGSERITRRRRRARRRHAGGAERDNARRPQALVRDHPHDEDRSGIERSNPCLIQTFETGSRRPTRPACCSA